MTGSSYLSKEEREYKGHVRTTSLESQKELPDYVPPKSGILAHVPSSWVPYGELMRIDKPVGIYLFWFPHLYGTLYARILQSDTSPHLDLLKANAILIAGTVFMRAAACAWNDNMDREFDRQVRRCRLRPIARGAITPRQGHIFTAVLTVFAFVFLFLLPWDCSLIAIPSIALLVLYPFAKRFTDFPQAILGFQVAWGAFLGMAAMGLDLHTIPSDAWPALLSFYFSNICWTIVYDTVYAHQDAEDDAKAGVRSMAVTFRNAPKALLTTFAILQVLLLVATGILANLNSEFFIFACGGVASTWIRMISTVDLKDPAQCLWWFKNGCWFVAISVAGGLASETMKGSFHSFIYGLAPKV